VSKFNTPASYKVKLSLCMVWRHTWESSRTAPLIPNLNTIWDG